MSSYKALKPRTRLSSGRAGCAPLCGLPPTRTTYAKRRSGASSAFRKISVRPRHTFPLSVKGTRPPECPVRRTDIEVEERRVRKQLYISVCQEFFTNFFQKIPALLCMTHEHRQDRRHAHRPQVLRQVGKHDLPRELTDDDKTVDERKSSPLGLLFDLFDAPRLCLAYFFSPRAT